MHLQLKIVPSGVRKREVKEKKLGLRFYHHFLYFYVKAESWFSFLQLFRVVTGTIFMY